MATESAEIAFACGQLRKRLSSIANPFRPILAFREVPAPCLAMTAIE